MRRIWSYLKPGFFKNNHSVSSSDLLSTKLGSNNSQLHTQSRNMTTFVSRKYILKDATTLDNEDIELVAIYFSDDKVFTINDIKSFDWLHNNIVSSDRLKGPHPKNIMRFKYNNTDYLFVRGNATHSPKTGVTFNLDLGNGLYITGLDGIGYFVEASLFMNSYQRLNPGDKDYKLEKELNIKHWSVIVKALSDNNVKLIITPKNSELHRDALSNKEYGTPVSLSLAYFVEERGKSTFLGDRLKLSGLLPDVDFYAKRSVALVETLSKEAELKKDNVDNTKSTSIVKDLENKDDDPV